MSFRPLGARLRQVVAAVGLTLVAVVVLPSNTPAAAVRPGGGGAPGAALHGPDVAVAHHEGATIDFDNGWRFALVNATAATDPTGAYADAANPGYDDSGWRAVHLPHDWSAELNPSAGPGTTAGTGWLPGGLGWYRKAFTLPPSYAGKQLAVEFDGVYMDSEVYLNGVLLGVHHYGYTGFSLDLTGAHTDGRTPNVLAVKVRNEVPSSRWYSGSGIYRNVRLVVTEPVHVQRLGVVVTTPDLENTVRAGYATAHVATTLDPVGGPQQVRVTSTVRDAAGRPVGAASTTVLAGAEPVTAGLDVRVRHPHLWDVTDPYLYSVTTQLTVDHRVVDTYVVRTGFRYTRLDPQGGFFLNGRSLKLQGVNLHHDLGALGAAVNRDALLHQVTLMKRMGVNALRTSHNPPAPELVQICEQLGIVMMVEAFDVWSSPKTAHDYARFFTADSDADIAEMVRSSRNSPAVVMWSIGNEIGDVAKPTGVPIARRLIDDVRAQDPTRPVVMGSNLYHGVPAAGSPLDQILLMLDGLGLNYNTAASMDALHARYPAQFFFESETSSETSTRGQYDQPEQLNTAENRTPGRRAASSYDNNLSAWTMSGEYALKSDRDRPWLGGQFLWSGIDYIGEPTPMYLWPVHTSFFGAADTAGFPKDQFYLFASQWTSTPMVHLVPMDWTDHRVGEPVQVWAYANVDTVELFLNGRSLGERRFDHKVTADGRPYLETTEATGDDKTVTAGRFPGSYTGSDGTAGHLRLTWTVPFEPGRLVAVARRGGRVVARDEVRTAGAPAAIRLSSERRWIPADGRSLAYVTAEVVDSDGVVVPDASNLVRFSASGGRLVGVDNGREESRESYKAAYRTAFHGKVLAIVTPTGHGPLTVTAAADGLRPGAVTVRTTRGGEPSAGQGTAPNTWFTPDAPTTPVEPAAPGVNGLRADASFSGADTTQPAKLVDGVTSVGGWSNAYVKGATTTLPSVSAARPADWVSLNWPDTRRVTGLTAWFTVNARHMLPASFTVSAWDGKAWQPVTGTTVSWATDSNQPTTITFDQVATTALRLDLASGHPDASDGCLGLAELAIVTG